MVGLLPTKPQSISRRPTLTRRSGALCVPIGPDAMTI